MAPDKKLSIYLNRYYSYHKIKDAESDNLIDITFEYIQITEDKIFKQPVIALRAIKVEMIDILIHHDNYVKEIEVYINELNVIVSKGPRLDKISLEKLRVLEEKRNILAEFVNLVEGSLAYIMRMLLEHYSELEVGKPFLDKFSEYLGPFDWMGKRADRFRNELMVKKDYGSKSPIFERVIIQQATKCIESSEITLALNLLLKNVQDQTVKKELILLNCQWVDFEKRMHLGLLNNESAQVTRNKIVNGILSIIPDFKSPDP